MQLDSKVSNPPDHNEICVFQGLVYLLFEDTFGMTLISEGAECILISKDFFKKYTDDAYLCKLSKVVSNTSSGNPITDCTLQQLMLFHIHLSPFQRALFTTLHTTSHFKTLF